MPTGPAPCWLQSHRHPTPLTSRDFNTLDRGDRPRGGLPRVTHHSAESTPIAVFQRQNGLRVRVQGDIPGILALKGDFGRDAASRRSDNTNASSKAVARRTVLHAGNSSKGPTRRKRAAQSGL